MTRRGGGPPRPYFSTIAGDYDVAGIAGRWPGGGERGQFNTSGNSDQIQGCDARGGRGLPFSDGCGADEPDRNGYRIQGCLENVFDARYATVGRGNQPGRAVHLTLGSQP